MAVRKARIARIRPPMRGIAALVVAVALLAANVAGAELAAVTYDGHRYVEMGEIASTLRAKVETGTTGVRARLKTASHVVTFTRNWAQILVDGKPVVLDAPVRVKAGTWLVPEAFVAAVLPSLRPAPAPKPSVTVLDDLRVRSYPTFTRVVLETSKPVSHRVETEGAGEVRIRVAGLAAAARAEEIQDGLVETVRLERSGTDALLRVRLAGRVDVKPSTLTDPPRLVLDFVRPAEPEPADAHRSATPLRTIVLDAGHGGHDPGAIGVTGLAEKDVVLDVTLRVARLCEERLGVKVILSRDDDRFVTLRDRTSFANRQRADLFVSIHANAHRETSQSGVETYFLSSEATDNAARQVAAQENGVVQLEKPGAAARMDIVKTILWDLAQSEFQVESSQLAEIVQDSITRSLKLPSRGVKQAGFYVLGGAAMPAILIEIGFVTNPAEERKLRDGRYRDDIAHAIFAGLAEYKRHYDLRMRAVAGPAR